MPINITIGIKYTNGGIVCMTSKIGVTILCVRSDLDIAIPVGRPITTDIITDVSMIAIVLIVSSHILKYPINTKAKKVPITNLILLLPQ